MAQSKDKSFPEKLKVFLKTFKGAGTSGSGSAGGGGPAKCRGEEQYLILTEEVEAELGPEAPLQTRLKAVKDLTLACKSRKAELHVVEKIWTLTEDLFRPAAAKEGKEGKHAAFELLIALCESPAEKSGAMRAKILVFLKSHENPEDFPQRFRLLQSLTRNGKDFSYFEDRIGPLLHDWVEKRLVGGIPVVDFMSFLVNVIKFNYNFVDQDILFEIIQNVCIVSCTCSALEDISECLNVLNVVLGYGKLPTNCLPNFLATLCRIVNVDLLVQNSWKIMRNLLGTHLGQSAIFTMCNFMESEERTDDVAVVRGAVFFVGVSLWGSKLVRTLKYSPNPILLSFDKALLRQNTLVNYEVMLRIQDLVKTNCENLHTVSWDIVMQIISKVLSFIKTESCKDDQGKLLKAVNDALDAIESVVQTKSFCGQVNKFYDLLDSCFLIRPIASVEKLMQYKVCTQLHTAKPMWFSSLISFAEKHLREEHRPVAKAKALPLITKICLANRDIYEEDLITKIILPHMKNLESEADPTVRLSGVTFLVDFLMESSSKKGHDLLHILDKILNRPYEIHAQTAPDTVHIYSESEVDDILRAVEGIVRLFKRKIYQLPSSIAVSAYKSLVKHLSNHYKKPAVLDSCFRIRYKIFECFFEIRANSLYHLGFPQEGCKELTYSPYLAVDHRDGDVDPESGQPSTPVQTNLLPSSSFQGPGSGNGVGVTYISLTAACKCVVCSLKKEKSWNVLQLVLASLPSVLENKALILSKHGNDIDYLATNLCAMILDKSLSLPDSLKYCPPSSRLSKTDFQAYLYPVFTALVSYHSHLDSATQQKIVKCLQHGLVTKSCRMIILALTVCTLEMKDTMHKLLPDVLLSLSKISPKVNIAIPVLEFLSTLIHLPRVFASFVQEQYMSIFAIALPYTDPFKFNHYTVSLAHHVIAMWFLKCRLSFRRPFVSYIIKGLESYVWEPMKEENRRYNLELLNEDSSNRKRSSSLTDRRQTDARRRPISGQDQVPAVAPRFDSKVAPDKSLVLFQQELTETCIDFMSRYCFADCSALPTRFNTTNFLIEGGMSQSWLVDKKIITITTSGCSQKELKEGVCDKCYLICRKQRSLDDKERKKVTLELSGRSLSARDSPNSGAQTTRRRHVSDFGIAGNHRHLKREHSLPGPGHRLPDDLSNRKLEAKDDLHLEQLADPSVEQFEETGLGKCVSSPFISDSSSKVKSETFICNCWCAGWAEILIRCPTGNTSWVMRVQNHIGNSSGVDIPVKHLSSVYLQNVVEPCQAEVFMNSNTSSTLSSPTHSHQPLLLSQNSISQDSVLAGSGTVSPNRDTPTTPDSPDDTDAHGRKNPVRRSNSSPEMSSNWKPSHVSLQKDIEEQDEDETLTVTGGSPLNCSGMEDHQVEIMQSNSALIATSQSSSTSTSPFDNNSKETQHGGIKGSSSPFRRSYEAIPEENTQRGGSFSSSPDAIRQTEVGLNPMQRDRGFTVSVMMPVRRTQTQLRRNMSLGSAEARESGLKSQPEAGVRTGVTPAFIFLQLCSQGLIAKGDKPILLKSDEATTKSLRVLDYIPPYETHKLGVLYVGPNQAKDEFAILLNQYGSSRYRDFLHGLGSLIKLKEIDPQKVYIGGLSRDGDDGEFACFWQDDVMQVIFHVATLMPNKPQDPQGNYKKRHIGNDFVAVVYNNSDEDFDISTIKAQFMYACVIIQPLEHRTNRVIVKAKPTLAEMIGHTEPKIVSDQNLPTMARQLALHANLASVIFQRMQSKNADPYASNWLERLRHIKRLRSRHLPDSGLSSSEELSSVDFSLSSIRRSGFEDFTMFV